MKSNPTLLFSIQSFLAYYINENFYSRHYAWCAPCFDTEKESAMKPRLPYTSNPICIYKAFLQDINTQDNHYEYREIMRNTVGILKGSDIMLEKGIINDLEHEEISSIVYSCLQDKKRDEYFRPIIYLIPFEKNKDKIRMAKIDDRAATLSPEYIVENFTRTDFEIIDLGKDGLKV